MLLPRRRVILSAKGRQRFACTGKEQGDAVPNIFGATETVEPGEVVEGATVGFDSPIDALYALSGATIVATELLSGGFVEVDPGAVAIDTVFSGDRFSRGEEFVFGVDSAAQIYGGTQSVN